MRNRVVLSASLLVLGSSVARAQSAPAQASAPAPVAASEKAPPAGAAPPRTQLKLETDNGTSIRFGFLTQLQYEAAGRLQDQEVSQNVFMRRMMLMALSLTRRRFIGSTARWKAGRSTSL